jgi:alcohol dehydrogenase, propanol-preferring
MANSFLGHQIIGRVDETGDGVTRGENHIRQARELGAAWAGSDFRDLPGKADGAVLFAPSGKLVPPTLEALDRGVACSIAGIYLSDLPSLDYGRQLYQERELRSVTANTREDARALLAEARVQPRTTAYALADANRALRDTKHTTRILSAEDSLSCGKSRLERLFFSLVENTLFPPT